MTADNRRHQLSPDSSIRTSPSGPTGASSAPTAAASASCSSTSSRPPWRSDPTRRRPPVNLGFVLDRSGSMGGQNKIGLARQAVLEAVHRLEDPDRFSAVVYDNEVEVVVGERRRPPARAGSSRPSA